MSDIKKRIHEASVAFNQGYKESALISLLIAMAATARKRYPKAQYGDQAAFTKFIQDEMLRGNFLGPSLEVCLSLVWMGNPTPLEKIIYDVRCNMVHEAGLHPQVVYDFNQDPHNFVLRIDEKGRFVFQDSLLDYILRCLHNVPENAQELHKMPFKKNTGRLVGGKPEWRVTVSNGICMPLS